MSDLTPIIQAIADRLTLGLTDGLRDAAGEVESSLGRAVLEALAEAVEEEGPDAAALLAERIESALRGEGDAEAIVALAEPLDAGARTALARELQSAEAEARDLAQRTARMVGGIIRQIGEAVLAGAVGG